MLNNKQIATLKGLANRLKPIVMIGKDGISDNLFSSFDDAFNTHELVKAKVLKSCDASLNELIIEICSNCHCEHVQTIGKVLIFYKRAKEPKILL